MQIARKAQAAGASYVGFGGFYPSRMSKYEVSAPPALLAGATQKMRLPVVVIGGMTRESAQLLVAQGVDMVATFSSVYIAEQPEQPVAALPRIFTA